MTLVYASKLLNSARLHNKAIKLANCFVQQAKVFAKLQGIAKQTIMSNVSIYTKMMINP